MFLFLLINAAMMHIDEMRAAVGWMVTVCTVQVVVTTVFTSFTPLPYLPYSFKIEEEKMRVHHLVRTRTVL